MSNQLSEFFSLAKVISCKEEGEYVSSNPGDDPVFTNRNVKFIFKVQSLPQQVDESTVKIANYEFGFENLIQNLKFVETEGPVDFFVEYLDGEIDNYSDSQSWENLSVSSSTIHPGFIRVPYNTTTTPIRTYKFTFDVPTLQSDESQPSEVNILTRYADNTDPLVVYAMPENDQDIGGSFPTLNVSFSGVSCVTIVSSLLDYINLNSDGLTQEDIDFIKGIVNGSGECEWQEPEAFEERAVLPADPQINYSNMNKLVCYLKARIVDYKTSLATVNTGLGCNSFVNCTIKSLLNLRRIYTMSQTTQQLIHDNYDEVLTRYNELAAYVVRKNAELNLIETNTVSWIHQNIDSQFNLSTYSCR